MKFRRHIDFKGIKEKLDLREVARDCGLRLDRRGYVCCPFHNEKTPSMKIDKERFLCFGCNERGDVFDFVGKYYGTDLMGALEWLNAKYHLGLNERMSRREKREAEEEMKFRQADRKFTEQRRKKIDFIMNHYTNELRELNGIITGEGDDNESVKRIKRRADVLNDVLDEYAAGDWGNLLMFYEKDRFSDGSFRERVYAT